MKEESLKYRSLELGPSPVPWQQGYLLVWDTPVTKVLSCLWWIEDEDESFISVVTLALEWERAVVLIRMGKFTGFFFFFYFRGQLVINSP